MEEQVRRWTDQGVVVVAGLHPKRRDSAKSTDSLRALLSMTEVAGLGEVGLGRSDPTSTWADQIWKLASLFSEAASHTGVALQEFLRSSG